jgi:hypothetical protein
MNLLKAHDNTQGSIGDMIELSHDDVDAVSGGGDCTVSYGTCRDTGGGHIVCSDTVVTCK